MAGYDGYSKSNNALAAEANGLHPLTAAIKLVRQATGCTAKQARQALLANGAVEWHHTSCHYNRTNYYSVADGVQSARALCASSTWPADWHSQLSRAWPSSRLDVADRQAVVDALLANKASEWGASPNVILEAYYAAA